MATCGVDREAIAFFKGALARNVEVKDRPKDARLYRALEQVFRRLVDEVTVFPNKRPALVFL